MCPFFPSATTEIPENPKKEPIRLWLPEGPSPLRPRCVSRGREGGEKASVSPLIFWLPSLEQRGEAEDVVSTSSAL